MLATHLLLLILYSFHFIIQYKPCAFCTAFFIIAVAFAIDGVLMDSSAEDWGVIPHWQMRRECKWKVGRRYWTKIKKAEKKLKLVAQSSADWQKVWQPLFLPCWQLRTSGKLKVAVIRIHGQIHTRSWKWSTPDYLNLFVCFCDFHFVWSVMYCTKETTNKSTQFRPS